MKKITETLLSKALLPILVAALTVMTSAQHLRNTDYSPDKALKSNARVNPSTLAMELSIPLAGYTGRAGTGMPITVSYSSKVWEIQTGLLPQWQTGTGQTVADAKPQFGKRTVGGWTSSLATPGIDYKYDVYQGNNQDVLYEGQMYAPAVWENLPDNDLFYIKRLRVQMPDGSSHEFRAGDTPIDCGSINYGCSSTDFTGTFLSVDGSRMRLESGASTSTLFLPDGSRYIFGAMTSPATLNLAHTFYDRHGNKMTFNISTSVWTDTMGRELPTPFPYTNGFQTLALGDDQEINYPGFGNEEDEEYEHYTVTLSAHYLIDENGEDALDPSLEQTLRNRSDKYACAGSSFSSSSGPNLFVNSQAEVRVCGGVDVDANKFNPVLLTKITLPNGQYYQFKYNHYGEIVKVTYPNGAYERFAYAAIEAISRATPVYDQANRGVTDRWLSVKGDGTDEVHWTYAVERGTALDPEPYRVTITAPDTSYTVQYLVDEPVADDVWRPYGFGNEATGRSYEDRVHDTNDNLIQRKLTAYGTSGPLSGGWSGATRDMRPTVEVSITFEPGNSYALATMTETVYDTEDTVGSTDPAYFSSLNPKQTKTYNYVAVSASTASTASIATAIGWFSSASPAVVNEMYYLYDSNYKARNINGLVTQTRVKDASGNVKAKTEISYDDSNHTESSSGTMPSAASGSWVDPTDSGQFGATIGTKRGNPTIVKSYYDIANSYYIQTESFYDQYGNLRKTRDGRGNDTTTAYDDDNAFAYPTSVTTPVPDSNGTYGSSTALTTSMTYDFNTGLPLTTTDPNGAVTKMDYEDALLRPTKVTTGYGTSLAAETITEYGAGTSASTRWVKVKSQIDASTWKEAKTFFDGLGRTVRTQSIDDDGDVFVLTCYDNIGRVSKASNPFRGWTTQDCSTTSGMEWTTNTFDTAGRPWKVTTPDGAEVVTTYELAATSGYLLGTVVTVEDQADKLRRSITNALGQLKRVDEPSGTSGLGSLTAPYQPTLYDYDLLNNLTGVLQEGDTTAECGGASSCTQSRSFAYDALSRLKQAVNPESGTINYTYDNNGNLATKADARSITTTYTYDRLNRVTNRAYTNEPSGSETPDVSYYYDNLTNAKGKLIKVSSSISTRIPAVRCLLVRSHPS